jgi:hypothetical protein
MSAVRAYLLAAAAAAAATAPVPLATSPLVGAWYFSGWFECFTPGCYSHFNGFTPRGQPLTNFFPAYPSRTPLLGTHTDKLATIEAEVHAADAAGLDFFHMLFYDSNGERDCGPNPDRA